MWLIPNDAVTMNSVPPDVSVIIPVYKRRAMLEEAVASVLLQKGVAFELIVIDDGSDDVEAWHRAAGGNRVPIRLDRIAHRV